MKTRQVIYFVIGIICALIQVHIYQVLSSSDLIITPKERAEPGFLFGYYLAANLLLIPTILCGIGVYRIWRKLKKRNREEQDAFLK
jgi:hypothetical protein